MRNQADEVSKRKPTDAEKLALKGQVKEVFQARYKSKIVNGSVGMGKLSLDEIYKTENFHILFDTEGYMMSNNQYTVRGVDITNYASKNLISEHIDLNLNHEIISKFAYLYDEKGNISELINSNNEGAITSKTVNRYDENNKLIETLIYYGENIELSATCKNEYDERGNLIKAIHYLKDNIVNYTYTSVYDNNNRQIESYFLYEGSLMKDHSSGTKYKYNEQGDIIELIKLDKDRNVKEASYFSHEYDENGQRIRENKQEETNSNKADDYEYDENGNWTSRLVYNGNTPILLYLRLYIYYSDPLEKTLQPIVDKTFGNMEITEKNYEQNLTADEIKWLAEASGTAVDSFPVMRYYSVLFKDVASITIYQGPNIEAMALKRELSLQYTVHELYSYHTIWEQGSTRPVMYTLAFPEFEGYLLHAPRIQPHDADNYQLPPQIDYDDNGYVYTSQFQLLRPSEASGKRVDWFEKELYREMLRCTLYPKPEKPRINIIETNNNSFVMKEHPVSDSFEIKDLDLNYGQGFSKFHEDLMYRFNTSKKGLVLFHGLPGTGKTYYIRHLLKSMVSARKVVIYMPPNMVDHLTDPNFMTFLIKEVKDWSEDGFFCVLLIEDAEPLLAKRQEGVRIQGVTNLLNMTDGLLNDMLQLQIICTFNVDLKKLDSALLRPGRLLARKEFKELDELDANLLAQRLGIKHHFKKPATLSEIYAMKDNQATLIHDVEQSRGASTAIDDL